MQVRLSQWYDKLNTVVEYCAVEVNLHAFRAMALDGVVPLTSTSDGLFRSEMTTATYRIGGVAWQRRKDRLDERKFSWAIMVTEPEYFVLHSNRALNKVT